MATCTASPDIRTATTGDLPTLSRANPGDADYFADRLRRQSRGLGELIVAWLDGRPVGDLYIWLEPADEPEIRSYLPGVPILQRAKVVKSLRCRGIGTRLFTRAESILRSRGYSRVALAVERTNLDAARLYRRLGYRNWNRGTVVCQRWKPEPGRVSGELCDVLVKSLSDNLLSSRRVCRRQELTLNPW